MKVVHIGAGSFVFAPTVLVDAIMVEKISECELVLVDVNEHALNIMSGVGQRMAEDLGVNVTVRTQTDREIALREADYVIVSAAIQGARRWQMDYDVLNRWGLATQARECGGLGGLVNSFRAITLVMDIARDMERLCPKARLLAVTNPMPRVVTAVNRFSTIECFGFCNIAWGGPTGYQWIGDLINIPVADLDIVTAGLNHFAWLVSATQKSTGQNLLPKIVSEIGSRTGFPYHHLQSWYEQYGAIAAGHVDHHAEYLPELHGIHYHVSPPFHGTVAERNARFDALRRVAKRETSIQPVLENLSWEHPIGLVSALAKQKGTHIDILNVVNRGSLPQLPDGRIVEVPVQVSDGQVRGMRDILLPDKLASLCKVVSDVHELVTEAAVKGDRRVAEAAILMDPAITDKGNSIPALTELLDIHRDLLPQFF